MTDLINLKFEQYRDGQLIDTWEASYHLGILPTDPYCLERSQRHDDRFVITDLSNNRTTEWVLTWFDDRVYIIGVGTGETWRHVVPLFQDGKWGYNYRCDIDREGYILPFFKGRPITSPYDAHAYAPVQSYTSGEVVGYDIMAQLYLVKAGGGWYEVHPYEIEHPSLATPGPDYQPIPFDVIS